MGNTGEGNGLGFTALYIIINKQFVHVRPSDFNNLSAGASLKSPGEVRSILLDNKETKVKTRHWSVCVRMCVCACVRA